MKIDFTGQNILITGGTKGIGKKLVDDYKKLGGNVWFTGRDKLLKNDNYFCVDFSDSRAMDTFTKEICELDIDILVNNAGTNKIGNIEEYDISDYEKIINLNLTSCFKTTQAIVPKMKTKKYGRIVNITSISSFITMPLRSAYCSSKFGLLGLTKSSAVELAKYNILINAVGPGVTQTELTVNVLGTKRMKEIAEKVPIKRLATVDDISTTVMFISSNLNTYIVGQNILVDGGYTCV